MAKPVKGTRTYTSPRRQQHAAATRLAILESATRLFEAQGYAATTMDAIAALDRVAQETFERQVRQLSTGERQRLAIVRALALAPPVLLLDEPTAPLDPESVGRVEAVLRERLQAGTTIVLVTHDPRQAERLGAQAARMRRRQLEGA